MFKGYFMLFPSIYKPLSFKIHVVSCYPVAPWLLFLMKRGRIPGLPTDVTSSRYSQNDLTVEWTAKISLTYRTTPGIFGATASNSRIWNKSHWGWHDMIWRSLFRPPHLTFANWLEKRRLSYRSCMSFERTWPTSSDLSIYIYIYTCLYLYNIV